MSIYDELNRNPSRRQLVSFGLIFLAGMGALGAWLHFRGGRPTAALAAWIAGGAVMLFSLIPPIGRVLYILWMGLGLTLGFFTSPVIMGIVYLLVIVPVAVVFKLRARDAMRRKLDRKATTYWEPYPSAEDPATYLRQF